MSNNRTPFGVALGFSILTFLVSLALFWMMPALPEYFATTFGWGAILPCLLLALLVGFLIWLNLTLSAYDSKLADLKFQLQALEEKLKQAGIK